jgi:hypothetical protein
MLVPKEVKERREKKQKKNSKKPIALGMGGERVE